MDIVSSITILLSASFLLGVLLPGSSQAQDLIKEREHALAFARSQLLRTLGDLTDTLRYPRSTLADGSWQLVEASDWTSGFFPGALWLMYERTGEEAFLDGARRWTGGLASQKDNRTTHDLGFMLYCSFGNEFRLQGDAYAREVLLEAAATLASRFNPRVGCIKSWDWNSQWQYPVIIDNMMNLELLFWASRNGGGPRLREVAIAHADRTIQNHLRPDGSSCHVVNYDSTSGRVIDRLTHQGAADTSTWARGQAWGLYGFAVCFRETHEPRFLEAAERMADYFVRHLPPDGVPYWDFDAEGIPEAQKDASAGAIAASGLLELAALAPEKEAHYRSSAERILRSLASSAYLAEGTASRGILNHCVGDKHHGVEVDVSLIYADYYFLEALLRHRALKPH